LKPANAGTVYRWEDFPSALFLFRCNAAELSAVAIPDPEALILPIVGV